MDRIGNSLSSFAAAVRPGSLGKPDRTTRAASIPSPLQPIQPLQTQHSNEFRDAASPTQPRRSLPQFSYRE